jgi:iron(III) transport system permease protein
VAVAAEPSVGGGRRRRPAGWAVVGAIVALVVAGPLIALPLAFLRGDEALNQISASLLPEALRNSVILAVGVGIGTLLVGGAMAALVSFYDFPGRRWLDWALILPLAVPAYVLVFVLLGQYDEASTLQSGLRSVFGDGFRLPEIRSTAGAIAVLTAVLYPYVYALGRAAFLEQSRDTIEAARTLGLTHAQAIRRVAFPLARPALGAGAILAIMEALADFGAVNLLNYRAMTDAIYRVWYGAFDRDAALQLATVLVSLALTLVAVERLLRGRARYHGALARGEAVIPRRLHGWRGVLAAAAPIVLLLVVFAAPLAQLVGWSIRSLGEGAELGDLAVSALTTLLLGVVAALVAVITATVITYGRRTHPTKIGTASATLATLGYAVPGSVVAVAIYLPLAWVDRRLGALVLTGSAIGLVIAYVVRFQALAMFAVDARMSRIDPAMDDAARSLGADHNRILGDVHLPLLWPGITTAALLVFVEVMKELPATALLRPLGNDTLAVAVWEATKDSRFDTAALPALLIVLVGLIPVVTLMRVSRAGTPLDEHRR